MSTVLQTRAEILERVVEQVKGLQQKNAELKSKMEKVPAQTSEPNYLYVHADMYIAIRL